MVRRVRPNLTLLALLTTAGLLSAAEGLRPLSRDMLASIRSQQPQRASLVTRGLEAAKASLGLGMLDGLKEFNQVTDAYGRTHVRYHQTYRGVEVYNGLLVGHMDASGRLEAPHAAVQTGIDLAPATLLSESKIQEIAARNLPKEGKLLPMLVKPLVFPTQYQDGIKAKRVDDQFVIDPMYSVGTRRKSNPYLWAYQVSTLQATPKGPVATEFIIDGQSGDILKKWDGMQHAAAVGTGKSQYSGNVTLNTEQLADGTYTLRDTTRATRPHPLADKYPELAGIGFQTLCWDDFSATGFQLGAGPFVNASNAWGDGAVFNWATDWPGELRTSHGQTAAVDAHYDIQATWDYYQKVLGRTGGIDGQGASPASFIHMDGETWGTAWLNASWSPSWFVMMYGDGATTGSLTCLDVAAHEMSHGVFSHTASLNGPEGGGINEGNSDIHATMVKFYYWGTDGTGSTIPETAPNAPDTTTPMYMWQMGRQLYTDGTAMRYLYKPSLDGMSYDAWFDGIGNDDVHFACGPTNRAFYFLSQGASSDATKDTYSPFLPAGMTGITNDKAIKIWYNGMVAHIADPSADYHAVRQAMIDSATEVGTADDVAAVENAFAAVNIGTPHGGQEHVTVTFPAGPNDRLSFKVVPAMMPISLPAPSIAHATDSSYTWSLGGLSAFYPEGGKLEDSKFTAPMIANGASWPVKATSKQDPKQFAVEMVFGGIMDIDSDTDTDACDMGAMALAYGHVNVYPAANIYGGWYGCDDTCVEIFLEGFQNAFNQ